ncbi:MAG: ParB N-terminal domain-containing protein [Ruminiclostridium sp.]|nr:ParB N-terminal domain-containing protein [Ruminiclostridium sp.]
MKIVSKKLSELHPIEKNIRRHPEKQIKEYVRSIEMFGQTKPLVIDEEGTILIGNGLYEALKVMGKDKADCNVMSGLTEKQKKKLMLADNRVYELGFTDTGIFDEIIRELDGDIDVPGWDADLLEMLNSSVQDANEMVASYGTFSTEEVETVNNTERIDHSEPSAAAAPLSAPAAAEQDAGNDETPSGNADAVVERTIICPHCGERICL